MIILTQQKNCYIGEILYCCIVNLINGSINYIFLQVNLHDRFGEVMLNNLRCRGCDLQGAETCRDLNTQETR